MSELFSFLKTHYFISTNLMGIYYGVSLINYQKKVWKILHFQHFPNQISSNILIRMTFEGRFVKPTLQIWCKNIENFHKPWNWRPHWFFPLGRNSFCEVTQPGWKRLQFSEEFCTVPSRPIYLIKLFRPGQDNTKKLFRRSRDTS